MGLSKIELRRTIREGMEQAAGGQVAVTVFQACDFGTSDKIFVQAVYINRQWIYTRTDGTVIVDGVDFEPCP